MLPETDPAHPGQAHSALSARRSPGVPSSRTSALATDTECSARAHHGHPGAQPDQHHHGRLRTRHARHPKGNPSATWTACARADCLAPENRLPSNSAVKKPRIVIDAEFPLCHRRDSDLRYPLQGPRWGHHRRDQRLTTVHRGGRYVLPPTLIPRESPPDPARMWHRRSSSRSMSGAPLVAVVTQVDSHLAPPPSLCL